MKTKQQLVESEVDFMSWVLEYAKLKGWLVAHFRGAWSKDGKRYMTPVQADGKGWPDLVLARETPNGFTDIIFAECKSKTGKLSPEQEEWLILLSKVVGSQVYVWKPADRETIMGILK